MEESLSARVDFIQKQQEVVLNTCKELALEQHKQSRREASEDSLEFLFLRKFEDLAKQLNDRFCGLREGIERQAEGSLGLKKLAQRSESMQYELDRLRITAGQVQHNVSSLLASRQKEQQKVREMLRLGLQDAKQRLLQQIRSTRQQGQEIAARLLTFQSTAALESKLATQFRREVSERSEEISRRLDTLESMPDLQLKLSNVHKSVLAALDEERVLRKAELDSLGEKLLFIGQQIYQLQDVRAEVDELKSQQAQSQERLQQLNSLQLKGRQQHQALEAKSKRQWEQCLKLTVALTEKCSRQELQLLKQQFSQAQAKFELEVYRGLEETATTADLQQAVRHPLMQAQRALAAARQGRWLWTSGVCRNGLVLWTDQVEQDDAFAWQEQKVVVLEPGVFAISLGFFGRKKPAVQVLVDGHQAIMAVNSGSYVVHHSSGRLKDVKHPLQSLTGLTLTDFLHFTKQARVEVQVQGEAEVGFLALRRVV